MAEKTEKKNTPAEPAFTKEAVMNAKRYLEQIDLLSVLLSNDRKYTHDDVKKIIADYMKKEVK